VRLRTVEWESVAEPASSLEKRMSVKDALAVESHLIGETRRIWQNGLN
jgi:hypothetical protein